MFRDILENLDTLIKASDLIEENQAKRIVKPVFDKILEKSGGHICEIFKTNLGQEYDTITASLSTIESKNETDRQRSDPYILTGRADPNFWVWVYETKQTLWVENLKKHNKELPIQNKASGKDINPEYIRFFPASDSLIVIPLIFQNTVWGIFSIESSESEVFNKDMVEELKLLCTLITKLLVKSYVQNQNKIDTDDAIDKFQNTISCVTARVPFPEKTGFIAHPYQTQYNYAANKLIKFFESKKVRIVDSLPIRGGASILDDLKEKIARSHFGIADITQLNRNVLFELGMMLLCMPKEDVLIYRHKEDSETLTEGKLADLPSDIKDLNRIIYYYSIQDDELRIDVPGTNNTEPCFQSLTNFLNQLTRRNADFRKANDFRS